MPYLHVRLSASPAADRTRRVAESLTGLTGEILHKKRELTSVAVEYVDAGQWYVGGLPVAEREAATFYLEVHVTEGTNTKDEKARYVKEVFAAMQTLLGPLHPASYVVVKDVAADSWGYKGVTQEFRYVNAKTL